MMDGSTVDGRLRGNGRSIIGWEFWGGIHPDDDFYVEGLIDEVNVYGRALDGDDIQALFEAGSSGL